MHTVIVLTVGFALLGGCALAGRMLGSMPTGLLLFLPLWFIGAGINMYFGVAKAGYSVADEAPMFLLVFSVPALAALLAWYKHR